MRERLSPNVDARPDGRAIDMLILHYTGMQSAQAALDRLCDPIAKVSSHYLIEEDGCVWRLVPEEARAWHAGVSYWRGVRNTNDASIGIELVNPGHEFGYRPFPEAQMQALERLALEILDRHPIAPRNVVGHSDVAPARKTDPGELFDWWRLAAKGIGLWPAASVPTSGNDPATIAAVQNDLAQFGYEAAPSGVLDDATRCVLRAFQRHFRQARIDGEPDAETRARLAALVGAIG
jgi:N-acetylmuramoyl-L-alanine amidase